MAIYAKLEPAQAKSYMDRDAGIVLDVRSLKEFNEGHMMGAVLLPDSEIGTKAADMLRNKDELIMVYCRSGRRSEKAARALLEMGYGNVYDIGGIMAWPYETVKEPRQL